MTAVPSLWYKEMVNELARYSIEQGAKNGMSSNEYKTAKERWQNFKKKYTPSKTVKNGDLVEAKKFIATKSDKIKKITSIKDKNDPYNLIGIAQDKFFLSNEQTTKLMNYMSTLNLLY